MALYLASAFILEGARRRPGCFRFRFLGTDFSCRISQNSFCVRLGFSALIPSHSLIKSIFWVAVHRVHSAWQTTLFWCRDVFGFGSAFLTIFCKLSSFPGTKLVKSSQFNAKQRFVCCMICSHIYSIGKLSPSIFKNIGHEPLEILVIACPNAKR